MHLVRGSRDSMEAKLAKEERISGILQLFCFEVDFADSYFKILHHFVSVQWNRIWLVQACNQDFAKMGEVGAWLRHWYSPSPRTSHPVVSGGLRAFKLKQKQTQKQGSKWAKSSS